MTHEQNERLLTLLSEYLCFQPDAIAPADVSAFSADAHLPQEEAYRMLLSAKLGLDPDRAEDWLLIRDALPKIIRRCDPADYAQDEYLRRGQRVGDQHLGRYERRAPHGDGEQRREVVSVFRIFCHAAPKLLIFWLLTLISTRRIRVI